MREDVREEKMREDDRSAYFASQDDVDILR